MCARLSSPEEGRGREPLTGRPPKVKGSWVMGRISQAKGTARRRASWRVRSWLRWIDADRVTLFSRVRHTMRNYQLPRLNLRSRL